MWIINESLKLVLRVVKNVHYVVVVERRKKIYEFLFVFNFPSQTHTTGDDSLSLSRNGSKIILIVNS